MGLVGVIVEGSIKGRIERYDYTIARQSRPTLSLLKLGTSPQKNKNKNKKLPTQEKEITVYYLIIIFCSKKNNGYINK